MKFNGTFYSKAKNEIYVNGEKVTLTPLQKAEIILDKLKNDLVFVHLGEGTENAELNDFAAAVFFNKVTLAWLAPQVKAVGDYETYKTGVYNLIIKRWNNRNK